MATAPGGRAGTRRRYKLVGAMRSSRRFLGSAFVAMCALAGNAAAQTVPSEPVTFGGGRVVLGGDVAATVAPQDLGYFNYTDYEQTTFRQFRLGMSALVRVSDRVSVLGELRSANFDYVTPFALYARIRPLPKQRFDIQIGRIPPTFGAFSRRTYSNDNPLIGTPLAYQYLTSLRADSIPVDVDELLRMRGRGWLSAFSVGNAVPYHGVPMVTAFTWDTGVQVSTGWKVLTGAIAVTNGTVANPRVSDDNRGKQLAARISATPIVGLIVGGSYARGEFLNRHVQALRSSAYRSDYDQHAAGIDVEYSRAHWLARAESVLSEWRMPLAASTGASALPLRALATLVEGRYAFLPGLYGAARVEYLGFNRVASPVRVDEWDAPVTRAEFGGGVYLQRNVVFRMSVQVNRRDGGRVRRANLAAAQILYWF